MIINFTQRGCDEGQVTPFEFKDLMVFLEWVKLLVLFLYVVQLAFIFHIDSASAWFPKRDSLEIIGAGCPTRSITGLKGTQSTDTDEENHTLDLNLSSSISDSRRKEHCTLYTSCPVPIPWNGRN